MNAKQINYSRKQVFKAIQQVRLRCFLVLMLIVTVPATIVALTEFDNGKEAVAVIGGVSMASMLAIGNVEGVPDREVAGEALSYKVWLIHYNQIDDSVPFFNPNAAREVGNIPLKSGERAHYFMAHDIPQYTSSGERGDLTIAATNTFIIIMGGVRDQLLNFIEEYAGGKFLVIFEECGKPERYILGTPCRPMVLRNFNLKNDKENRSVTFTFESRSITQYFKYTGVLEGTAPLLHPAGTTTLTIQPGRSAYRIPNGASAAFAITALAGLSANDEGRFITLFGEGTNNAATIADSANIVLKNGATWTARAGSQITFRVFDSQTLIETSRIQTA